MGAELISGYDHCCRSIGKETRRNQVGNGKVLALNGQGTKLNRHEGRRLRGIRPHIICCSRNACCSRHTSEAEDRNSLDVWRESHPIYEQGVNRGTRYSGDRSKEQSANLLPLDSCMLQRTAESLFSQF